MPLTERPSGMWTIIAKCIKLAVNVENADDSPRQSPQSSVHPAGFRQRLQLHALP